MGCQLSSNLISIDTDLETLCQWENTACLQHSAYKDQIKQLVNHCTSRVEKAKKYTSPRNYKLFLRIDFNSNKLLLEISGPRSLLSRVTNNYPTNALFNSRVVQRQKWGLWEQFWIRTPSWPLSSGVTLAGSL